MLKLIVLLLLVVLGVPGFGCTLHAQDFSGTYTVASSTGPMTLSLHQDANVLTGTLVTQGVTFQVDGRVTIDEEDADVAVEGTLTGPQGGGDFTFYADDEGDGFYLLITPYDASGTPRLDMAAEFTAQRGEGVDAGMTSEVQQTVTLPGGGTRDPRLVGVWATQVIVNTPEGGMSTQLFMEIRADGVLVDGGARSMGSIPGVDMDTGLGGGGETALWHTQGNTLFVSYGGSAWVPLAQFEAAGNRLLLVYYDGDRKLWYRQ